MLTDREKKIVLVAMGYMLANLDDVIEAHRCECGDCLRKDMVAAVGFGDNFGHIHSNHTGQIQNPEEAEIHQIMEILTWAR